MKRGMVLLSVCVTVFLVIAVLLAGVGTAVSAATTTNAALPPIDSVEILGPMTATINTAYVFTAVVQPPTVTVIPKVPVSADIYINRDMTSPTQDGLVNTSHLSVFGPLSCTSRGDPYSNFSSPFRPPNYPPGPYTYRYRIFIPDTYTTDTLRIELFDPETHNTSANSATVTHTNYAISQGLAVTTTANCASTARYNPCVISTGEETLVNSNVTLDDVNILWFMRIDENRAPGCVGTSTYDPANNTTTVFELYYYTSTVGSNPQPIPLANYTGRPDDNHDTDLRWVSPGAPASFDQPVFVPTDVGSPKSFQLNLAQDLPNIEIDPETNGRYLYLDATSIAGSSENGFSIWAGPATYTATIPSDANARNVAILNNPGSHSSGGVKIFSVGYLPQNSNTDNRVNVPLIDIGPEYAGETVTISLFDADTGTNPPITFFFDSMAFNQGPPATGDWFLQFGTPNTTDPDGVPANNRCFPNSCNNQWITPPYQITVPGITENCDYNNPTVADCTPFFGGTLFASYDGGSGDTYGWEVSITEPTNSNPNAGCAAFPIAIELDARSIFPPGTGTGNDYPNPGDFHPSSPQPPYSNFPANVPDVPLQSAQPGYIYKVQNGAGAGSFAWLVWNIGINANSNTLENSLYWPGDSQDYTDHGDGGAPATPLYPHTVRGYVNPLDATDLTMNMTDWLALQTGAVNSSGLRSLINDHVTQARTLRLPVWNYDPISQGGNAFVQIAGFAIFRLQGHNLSGSGDWLLLEFVEWDTSCGQLDMGPTQVQLSNATAVTNNTSPIWLFMLVFLGVATAIIRFTFPGSNAQ